MRGFSPRGAVIEKPVSKSSNEVCRPTDLFFFKVKKKKISRFTSQKANTLIYKHTILFY